MEFDGNAGLGIVKQPRNRRAGGIRQLYPVQRYHQSSAIPYSLQFHNQTNETAAPLPGDIFVSSNTSSVPGQSGTLVSYVSLFPVLHFLIFETESRS